MSKESALLIIHLVNEFFACCKFFMANYSKENKKHNIFLMFLTVVLTGHFKEIDNVVHQILHLIVKSVE